MKKSEETSGYVVEVERDGIDCHFGVAKPYILRFTGQTLEIWKHRTCETEDFNWHAS